METIFFPRNDYPNNIEVCAHRLGKKMTYTESTDTLKLDVSYDWILEQAKSRNIKVSAFAYYAEIKTSSFSKAKNDYDNGRLWLDIYGYWSNVSDTNTKEEWDAAYTAYMLPNFIEALNKKPIAMSESYNSEAFKNYTTQLLVFKDSNPQSASNYAQYPTNYGIGYGSPNNIPYNFSNYHTIRNTTRWFDNAKRQGAEQDSSIFSRVLSEVSNKIDITMQNGGWFNNFTHWHQVYPNYSSVYEDYFDMLASKNANNEIYFAGYGEAVAYLVYRQLITKAVMYSPIWQSNTLIIQLEAKNTLGIDTDLLQVPISIKFSTVNTPLENKEIKSEHNLITLGNNEYIIEISYNEYSRSIITKK